LKDFIVCERGSLVVALLAQHFGFKKSFSPINTLLQKGIFSSNSRTPHEVKMSIHPNFQFLSLLKP